MAQPTGFAEFPRTFSSGVIVNPGSGQVLVDTGVFDNTRVFKVLVVVSSTAAGEFDLQHRDTANATNVDLVPVLMGASAPAEFYVLWLVETTQRVRVVTPSAITGSVSVVLNVYQAAAGPSIGWM